MRTAITKSRAVSLIENRDGKELIARAIHKKENLGELKSLLEKHHNQAVVLDLKGVKLVDRDTARFLSKQADVLTRVHLDHLRGIDVELGPVPRRIHFGVLKLQVYMTLTRLPLAPDGSNTLSHVTGN